MTLDPRALTPQEVILRDLALEAAMAGCNLFDFRKVLTDAFHEVQKEQIEKATRAISIALPEISRYEWRIKETNTEYSLRADLGDWHGIGHRTILTLSYPFHAYVPGAGAVGSFSGTIVEIIEKYRAFLARYPERR